MNYTISGNKIIVEKCGEFDIVQTVLCGQIFRYRITDDAVFVYSKDLCAKVIDEGKSYIIESGDPDYFVNFFDLDNDYTKIKLELKKDEVLSKVIPFGEGIRILKNDPIEMIFSFVISANNNIKRIQQIIERLCLVGENCGDYFGFPSLKTLTEQPLEFYSGLGAGYRNKYLFNLSHQLKDVDIAKIQKLSTPELKNWLISLSGIGPKVADCIMLFGFNRTDVFPIDTWTNKVYETCYFDGVKTRPQIREFFVNKFGMLSGYAQQYLFFGARSFDILKEFGGKNNG